MSETNPTVVFADDARVAVSGQKRILREAGPRGVLGEVAAEYGQLRARADQRAARADEKLPLAGRLLPMTRASDHAPFWDYAYPAVMLTDTAFLRNPNYHQPTDTPDTLDYTFLANSARALAAALAMG